ncbi:hypothetical protein EDB84DRAFT_1673754 [Lactarius hengduanensis]|nr:hypothetical protein EDB84DRAFT_1673754 [Lactarius hengduanensis]
MLGRIAINCHIERKTVDKSLLHATEAILILRWQRHASYRINIVEFFRNIALSLGRRVNHSRSNEDSEYCIQYLRYLRELTPRGLQHFSEQTITVVCKGFREPRPSTRR